MRGNYIKKWLPILIGLLIPAGMAVAQVPVDSIAAVDSVNSPVPVLRDSVPATAVRDSVPSGPKTKKDALDDPVAYESSDSMVWNNGGYASLYGNGKVNYQNIQLTAGDITRSRRKDHTEWLTTFGWSVIFVTWTLGGRVVRNSSSTLSTSRPNFTMSLSGLISTEIMIALLPLDSTKEDGGAMRRSMVAISRSLTTPP